jgi:hypothetical protein
MELQVLDQNGRVAAGAGVMQEWINPIEEGMVNGDSSTTDANGFVLFPKRVLRNRLAFGTLHSAPTTWVFVCWQDQFGDFDWDGKLEHLAARLVLKQGICPYS